MAPSAEQLVQLQEPPVVLATCFFSRANTTVCRQWCKARPTRAGGKGQQRERERERETTALEDA
eukprot:4125123-Alexandrium_andersonii.AAC.1